MFSRYVDGYYFFLFAVHIHILWTDYTNTVLIYECYHEVSMGQCAYGAGHLTLLSRATETTPKQYEEIMELVRNMSITENIILRHINAEMFGQYFKGYP